MGYFVTFLGYRQCIEVPLSAGATVCVVRVVNKPYNEVSLSGYVQWVANNSLAATPVANVARAVTGAFGLYRKDTMAVNPLAYPGGFAVYAGGAGVTQNSSIWLVSLVPLLPLRVAFGSPIPQVDMNSLMT